MTRQRRYIILLLAASVSLTLGRIVTHDFSWWDDPLTLHQNPHFNPPTVEGVLFYWQHPHMDLYIPVTYTVWGVLAKMAYLEQPDAPGPLGIHLNPAIFHAASIAVHLLTTLIVFAILARLIGNDWAACAGALLFGLHPVQVEAVGWTSGMKDLLCGMFGFAAVWQYVIFRSTDTRREKTMHYVLAALAFLLSVLSKPTGMVIPLILGVLDFCVFRRGVRETARSLGPMLLFAVVWGIVTKTVQPAVEAEIAPLWSRPIVAADALGFYLYKIAWPLRLCLDYGRRPDVALHGKWLYLSASAPIVLGVALLRWRKRNQWLVVAGLLFLAGLAPVLGLVRFDFQAVSTVTDHYLYMPMLGPALALAWAVTRLGPRSRAAIFVWLAVLAGAASVQAGHWKNSEAIWRQAIRVNPGSWLACTHLGNYLSMEGRSDEAAELWRKAIELKSDYTSPRDNLGHYLLEHGRPEEAIAQFQEIIRQYKIRPTDDDLAGMYYDFGKALLITGRKDDAAAAFQEVLARQPNHAAATKGLQMARSKATSKPIAP